MCMERDYRVLLLELSRQITPNELDEIKFLCSDIISESRRDGITVLNLFRELEKQQKLGIDGLDCLICIFKHVKRQDLAQKLKEFQRLREVYLFELHSGTTAASTWNQQRFHYSHDRRDNVVADVSGIPSVRYVTPPREAQPTSNSRELGEVTLRCILQVASVGAWVGGCAFILSKYHENPDALAKVMTTVALPCGFMLKYMTSGSVEVTVWTADLQALEELWTRYKSGQLCKEIEKVLITEDLKKLAGGEEIGFTVQIDEYEYRNACLDLIVARNKATRIVASLPQQPRRVKSLQDITSPLIQLVPESPGRNTSKRPKDIHLSPCHAKPLSQLTKESSASSGFCSSIGSEPESSHALLSEFLHKSSKVHDVCGILDREMIICHDWRSLASKFSYKMSDIRLQERKESPTLALLEDVAFKEPATKLSELIDKLSELERDDVVDQILGAKDNDDPRALLNLPFEARKKFALELDHATMAQFTDVVHNIAKSAFHPSEIAALYKRPSPAMSLLEELETAYPGMDVSHLQEACQKGGVDNAVEILKGYVISITPKEKSANETVKRRVSLQRLHQIGGDSGLGISSPQSPTEEVPRRSPFRKS